MTGCPHKPKFSYKTTKKSKTVFFRLVTFRVLGQKLYWLYICWIWDTSQLRLCSIEATLAPSTQTAPVRSRADAQNFLCSVGDIAELFPSFSGAIFVKIRPGFYLSTHLQKIPKWKLCQFSFILLLKWYEMLCTSWETIWLVADGFTWVVPEEMLMTLA